MSDAARLSAPALCLVWAEPVGGLGPLAHTPSASTGLGALRRLLRSSTGGRSEPHPEEPAMYAEAERLAVSVARIAWPSVRVRWTAPGETAAIGDIALDRRLLDLLPGWDLPHRVDALMGMTLRDAAHAARTPLHYRQELLKAARAAGLLPSQSTMDSEPADGGPRQQYPPTGTHPGDANARPESQPFGHEYPGYPRRRVQGEQIPASGNPAPSDRTALELFVERKERDLDAATGGRAENDEDRAAASDSPLPFSTMENGKAVLSDSLRDLRAGAAPLGRPPGDAEAQAIDGMFTEANDGPQPPNEGGNPRPQSRPLGIGPHSDPPDPAAVNAVVTQLVALFLLVEARHVDAWLADGFPGFRGYVDTYWLWRLPATNVARRIVLLRGRSSFGVILDVAVALVTGRLTPSSLPDRWRPLFEAVDAVVHTIDHDSSPGDRYAAAIAVYRLVKASATLGQEDGELRREGKRPNRGGKGDTSEAPRNQGGNLDDDTEADRLAALEAFMAIALNGLDPSAVREGLTPEQQREVEALNAEAAHRRGAGKPGRPDEEESSFVANQRAYLPGARPMRLITPPVTTGARMRYDATYARMRGQIDALRQVLKFRLADRRHAICAQTSGQLDEQSLYRLAAHDERIFLRRAIESAPDQDLCILLDESASMGSGQVHVRAAIILFHHALQGMPGVRHWVFGFSGYGRGIALYRYISPSRNDLQQPQRLGAVSSREATPLAEAVAGAANAMLTEGQGREKLMIVVTDGHPDDVDGARRALRAAESRGVSIIGLGIAADAAAAGALFSHFTMYQDVASLHRKVGGLLRRVVGIH